MMEREWLAVLERYGQKVLVDGAEEKAFVQPIRDRNAQLAPSPLGLRREERAVYLGRADLPLVPRQTRVVWQGEEYEVRTARTVGEGHHIWAVLQRKEDEA